MSDSIPKLVTRNYEDYIRNLILLMSLSKDPSIQKDLAEKLVRTKKKLDEHNSGKK